MTNFRNTSQWDLVCEELIRSGAEFSNFLLIEGMHPSFRIIDIVLGLPDTLSRNLLGKVRVWLEQVIEWGMLARSLYAVREYLSIYTFLSWTGERVRYSGLSLK